MATPRWRRIRHQRTDDPDSDLYATQNWQTPIALLNSWTNVGGTTNPVGYWLDPWGVVHLRGRVEGGTINTGVTGNIFVLPLGYRPEFVEAFAVNSNNAYGSCNVVQNGGVRASTGSNASFSLDGITFRIAP